MKNLLQSLVIAFSMYSKIPMPRVDWNEKNMKYSMCFFTFIGAVIGALELGAWYLLELLIVYVGIFLMVLCAIPMAEGSMGAIIAGVGLMLLVAVVLMVVMLLFSMWLTPYTVGATAKFYEFTLSQRPDLFTKVTDTYTDDSFGNPDYPKLD